MPDENGNDQEQDFEWRSRKGYRWLLRYIIVPITLVLVVAVIAGYFAIRVAQTREDPPPPAPPEILEFNIDRSEITAGERVTIIWVVSGVESVSIVPFPQSFPSQGRITDTPQETTEYKLVASDGTKTASKIWQVIVNPIQPPTEVPIMPPLTEAPTSPPTPSPTSQPPPPTATFTPIPGWVTCISHDLNRTGWRLGDRLPTTGCSCLTGNWFCCPPDGTNQYWRLVRGAVIRVGEAPTYPDFTNQASSAADAWAQKWTAHNYRLIFSDVVAPDPGIGLIVGQEPLAQNQCLAYGSSVAIQVGVAPDGR